MGRSGGLVKRVFSRSRTSAAMPKCQHERSMVLDKIKWSAIKLYLCGEEFNSVQVEDDSASCRGSEAAMTTMLRPASEFSEENGDRRAVRAEDGMAGDVSARERAAILIQAAFRGFLARQRDKLHDNGNDARSLECETFENTSIEVQMGDSVCISSAHEASITLQDHAQRRARSQVFKPKEEWDDSTLSSSIAKLRIQNRLEATTRRERALAYAFSQQLRTCMTKRRSAKPIPTELNLGWSWLERWMATRQQEHASELSQVSSVQRRMVIGKRFNAAVEEKESCGSNDVSVNFDASSIASQNPRNGCQPTGRRKSNSKRSASRRKITASNHCAPHSSSKMIKREHEEEEIESETTGKQGKRKSREEVKVRDVLVEPPSDYQ